MSCGLDDIDLNSDVVKDGVHGVNTSESTVGYEGPLGLGRDSRIGEGLVSLEKVNGKASEIGHFHRKSDGKFPGVAIGGQIAVHDSVIVLGLKDDFQNTDTFRGGSTDKNNEGLEKNFGGSSKETVVDRGGECMSGKNEVEREVSAVSGPQHVEMKPNMGYGRAVNSGPVYGGVKPDKLLGESSDLVGSDLEWKPASRIKNERIDVKDATGVLVHLVDDAAPSVNGFGSNGNQGVVIEAQMKDSQPMEDIEIENSEQKSQAKEFRTEKGQFHWSDLVWGKVRSHPWWPGQIFDLSDASEKAKRYSKKDGFLIAYFGDMTFSWNEAPRIKPFQMHFSQMEKQNSTEAFSNAVDCALEEVSRRVEFGLSCSCLSPEVHDKLKTQIVVNAGICKESLTRGGGDESSSAATFLPVNLVKNIKALAQYPLPGIDRLEFFIARAQLLAFSRWKGFHCLPEFKMLDGSLEDGASIPVTSERKYSEDSRVREQLPLGKGKLGVQDASQKHKEISRDGVSSSKKERCLSDLMSRSHIILSNGEGEHEVKVGSGVKKRKALDSVPHDSGRENKKKFPLTIKKFSRVGESMRRVANQLAMSSPVVKDGSGKSKGESGRNKRSYRSNSERSRRRKVIIPVGYPSADEMLSQIYMASRDPLKGYNFLASSVNFLIEFRNSFCVKISTSQEDKNPTGEVSGKSSREKLHDLRSTETSGFDGMEDSYWTDMIVQSNTEEQVLFEPEISKESGSTTDVTEATLDSDQGLDSKQEAEVINRESGGKSEGCVDEKCEEEYTPTAFILNFADLESVPSESNLNKIFSRYGPLIESYTEVLKKSRRAKVVFKRRSDAETAFSSSGKFSIFGPSLVSYRLNYLSFTQRKTSISATKGSKKGATFVEGNTS